MSGRGDDIKHVEDVLCLLKAQLERERVYQRQNLEWAKTLGGCICRRNGGALIPDPQADYYIDMTAAMFKFEQASIAARMLKFACDLVATLLPSIKEPSFSDHYYGA